MSRPPQISRSFPLMTLLMAIPLVAALAYVSYDRYLKDDSGPNDGWWTYRNERHGYELRFPAEWKLIYETQGQQPNSFEIQTIVVAPRLPDSPGTWPLPHIFAAVNFQGGWCESLNNTQTRDITVSGVNGVEYNCYMGPPQSENCDPKPQCTGEPWTILRRFERNGTKFQVWGDARPGVINGGRPDLQADPDAAKTTETLRKILDSYRFTR